MYTIAVRKQKRRKRRLFVAGVIMVLLAAAGGVLYRLPVTLQDISRIIQLAAGKFYSSPADTMSAGDVLRGTVYDRNFKELSVSYQLFSLYVHPAKINNHKVAAEKLAAIIGIEKGVIETRLKQSRRVVELADDLDADQAGAIEALHLEGAYCTSCEKRYYPEHAAAPHILGYTVDGVGLSGVERKYDILLQPGEYQPVDAPDVDFKGNTVIGQKRTDLILTLDIELQKAVDKQLNRLLREQGAAVGMGLLLEPASGRILAFSNQPSFDPNYFWKSEGLARQNGLYSPRFDPDLVRPLLVRAAARIEDEEQFTPLLPQTLAATDFGLSAGQYAEVLNRIAFLQPVAQSLPSDVPFKDALSGGQHKNVSLMQLGVGLASLINGGWRITPTFVDSVYDQQRGQRFSLKKEAIGRTHVLTPAMGVAVRRELLTHFGGQKEKLLAFSAGSKRVVPTGTVSRYVQQQLFVGMIPREKPTMLLIMALERNTLDPVPKAKKKSSLASVGKTLLTDLYREAGQEQVAEYPAGKNRENFARFLISRRVEYTRLPESITGKEADMPELVGMSLRKGLQQLSRYNLRITIRGSGRIVSQSPPAGERLGTVERCQLILESEI
ncbi:MAG TPA: PASTA domain-containing protein [Desulfobulbus sp.]|nr:PASTA domain-containing protein [Desulfobulbus sp.]